MEFGTITAGIEASVEEKLDRIVAWGMTVWQPSAPELVGEDLVRVKDLAAERNLPMCALAAGVPISNL